MRTDGIGGEPGGGAGGAAWEEKAAATRSTLTHPGHVFLRVLKSMSMATLISRSKNNGQCIRYVPLNVAATFSSHAAPPAPPSQFSSYPVSSHAYGFRLFKTVVLVGGMWRLGREDRCDTVHSHSSRPRISKSAEINVDSNIDFAL